MMKMRAAILAGLLLSVAGTALAAPAKGPVYDERPAAITQPVAARD